MQNDDFFSKRLADLRMKKGVSARDMSLSLGQSDSYINKIENGKSFPTMQNFFYICEFLDISPKDFFDDDVKNPVALREAVSYLNKINDDQFDCVLKIIKDLAK